MLWIISIIWDILRQQVLVEVAPLIDRSLRDYRQHMLPLLTLSALALVLGNIPPSSYGMVCIVLLIQIVPLHLFPALFWDVSPTLILPAMAQIVALILIVPGVFNVGNALLNWGIIQALQGHRASGPIRLEDALPRQRWGTIGRLIVVMSLPLLGFTLGLGMLFASANAPSSLQFVLIFVGSGLALGLVTFPLLMALVPPVMFFDTVQPRAALRRSGSMFSFAGQGQYLALLTLVSLWAIGWLPIGVLFVVGLLLVWLFGGLSGPTLSSLALLAWAMGNIFVSPLLAIGSFHLYNAVRDRFAARPLVELTRTSLTWEHHSITFTAVLTFPDGLVVQVQMDEEEVAFARSILGNLTITTPISHAGEMHHLTVHTHRWKGEAGKVGHATQATLQIDGVVLHQEKLLVDRTVFTRLHDAIKDPPRQCVRLCPHDLAWAHQFRIEAEHLAAMLGAEVVAIHHIGSTAIPSLCAQPTIDILVEVRDIERVDQYNHTLAAHCYDARGEHGVAGRRFCARTIPILRTVQVQMFERGHTAITRHLAFRDYLIARPDEAQAYARLKEQLAHQFPDDHEHYTSGKSTLLRSLTARALFWYQAEGERHAGG